MESVATARRGRKRNLEKERLYWDLLASGMGSVEACRQVGVGRRTRLRWRRENGGIRPERGKIPAEPAMSGRYLSLFERERVQTLTSQDNGDHKTYEAGAAHQHATGLASRHRRPKLAADVWLHDFVQDKLELEWSPEQISGYLRTNHPEHTVSPETIYQGLYLPHRGALRRDLAKKLRTGRSLRQSHRQGHDEADHALHRPGPPHRRPTGRGR